jgi:isopenicillin N synthase-like dioxygenase
MADFSVPIVDLAAADAGRAVTDALAAASCAFIVNHGVDLTQRVEMREMSRAFFDLPEEEKSKVRWPGTGYWSGWQPVYEGAPELTGSRVPDLLERFEAQELSAFDLWPAEPVGFVDAWTEYYRQCGELSTRLMTLIAGTLDLPAEDLEAWTAGQFANLVVNNYLAQETPPLPGQVRVASHTDRGGFTLLWADNAPGGLQVKPPRSNEWSAVDFPPDVFLVQAGDLLARWTNNAIRANVHRVVNPPADVAATARRMALVYFHYPALDTVVTPAPSCVAGGRALPALVAGDHLLKRQEGYKVETEEGYAVA